MDLHQRQQFDFLFATAVERFVDRVQQRNAGAAGALTNLMEDPNGDGVWLDEFVDAFFQDFLLDNVDGACFVLRAVPTRTHDTIPAGSVGESLLVLAKSTFAKLLESKATERLQQLAAYQSVTP